jgi:undecaprenyl diphosphate synthase
MDNKRAVTAFSTLPNHLAIVMDGNGRWATQRGLSRMDGHRAGVDVALDIVKYCGELKIPYLTLYTFSSENWTRPADEVSGLMGLLQGYLTKKIDTLIENGVRLTTIGVMERLPGAVQSALKRVCEQTAGGTRMHLTLALSYGSRDEITRAVKKIAVQIEQGELTSQSISEDLISKHLDTHGTPDPDFWIRTSGEMRLSNFLLWQLSYAELYVSPAYWPDFKRNELDLALHDFAGRQRRFGMTSEQVAAGHLA